MEGKSLKQAFEQETGVDHREASLAVEKGPPRPVDNTLFCRYELKYRIASWQAAAVEQFVRPYLDLDPYSKLQPDSAYPIVGLYLDSGDFRLYRETLEGEKNRFKLRVRSYSDEPDSPCFFEIKRRLNNIIIKSRGRVKRDDVVRLLSGQSALPGAYDTEEEIINQFQLYVSYLNARPVVRVRYRRQAYEGGLDNRVRITFDRGLCYKVTKKPDVTLNSLGWQRVPLNFVILEIKFTGRYPAWLGQMVKSLNLRRSSMSKYASAIKQSCSLGYYPTPLSVW